METQNLNPLPDFSPYGYQVIQELGQNRAGGRVTYKAIATSTHQLVVIKEFQFSNTNSNWSGFKAYEREINVLRSLNHPGIPRYLSAFETETSFALVQEYIHAGSLEDCGQLSLDDTKQIAISILEVLEYLQNLKPPVFHRDIKPANILVNEEGNVALVDFGLARIGNKELAASSVVAGTSGFMPPEQLLNRELTSASDLYSLGGALICSIAGIRSWELPDYIDETFAIDTKKLLPTSLEPSFRWWLEKTIAPRVRDSEAHPARRVRFPNASAALMALRSGLQEPVAEEKLSGSKQTREIARTVTSVALAVSMTAGTLGGLGFGAYNLLQHIEQPQPQEYQAPIINVKPKPKVLTPTPKSKFPDSKQQEGQSTQIARGAIDSIGDIAIISSLIFGVLRLYLAFQRDEEIWEPLKMAVLIPTAVTIMKIAVLAILL